MIKINGNVVEQPTSLILHIVNSVSREARGFALTLFQAFPATNLYAQRRVGERGALGTTVLSFSPPDHPGPCVAHLIAQRYPGPSKYDNDTLVWRRQWFLEALTRLHQDPRLGQFATIGLPRKLGTVMDDEEWADYETVLQQFARAHPQPVYLVHDQPPNAQL